MKVFEYHNNVLCIIASILFENLGLLSKEAYLKKCQRSSLKRERKGGGLGSPALINYELLPQIWKNIIVEKFGDPNKKVKNDSFINHIKYNPEAANYYREYIYDGDKSLSIEKQLEYCTNVALLDTIDFLNKNKSTLSLWENSSEIINNIDKSKFPHSLPINPRSLQRVFFNYRKNGFSVLIHKNYGNNNSEKINPAAKEWILSRWTDRVNKVVNETQLFHEYNTIAINKGWKILENPKTIKQFLFKSEIQELWWGHRYGELKSKEKFSLMQSTKMPTMRDSLWYSDGTKLNYFYLNNEGKVSTISVYEVMDAYSEVLLGYCISETEDYKTQYSAYKQAIQFAGHKPYQLGFDNQGGHKKLIAGSFLSKISHLAIRTQPYNGKSKTIESAFGRFQSQFLKQDWFFTGQNIQAKKNESKANLEFINANKNNLPTLAEIKEVYKKRRDEWNNAPHHATGQSRMEMYLLSQNPATPKVELWDMVEMFWILREQPVMYNAYGLTFTEKKTKYTYCVYTQHRVPDMNFHRKSIDKKFYIKFDPEDMTTVFLYDKDASGNLRFVARAETKVEIARNIQEQTTEDHEHIKLLENMNKTARIETVDKMDEILAKHGMHVEQYGLNTPNVLGITTKKKGRKKANNTDFGKVQKEISEMVKISNEEEINIYKLM